MNFRILYQDDSIIAIDKPAGFQVHPPENPQHKISNQVNCLRLLNKQLNRFLYPVHRIDRATSGVLLFAFNSNTARYLCDQFQQQNIKKTYYCITRGWVRESGSIIHPLKSEHFDKRYLDSITKFNTLATIELPHAVGRYCTSRYSLVRVEPTTGRKHQIRRHFAHLSHPLIGDSVYGDTDHNHFFKHNLNISGLLLKAYSISLIHPDDGKLIQISSRWNGLWHQIFDLFGVCPLELHAKGSL